MKLLGITKTNITKEENVENLEITEVVLVYCDTDNSDYEHYSIILYTLA